MRILAIERDIPGADAVGMRRLLVEEAAAAWTLQKRDVLREIWFTADHRAVLLLECENETAAREALDSLPLFREGYIDFEILALLPYDGFERLFGQARHE